MSAKSYRKKPVVVDAWQWDGSDNEAYLITAWIGQAQVRWDPTGTRIGIHTLEGTMWASPGDFIIKGIQGEFYPCKPDIFWGTYDEILP